MLLRARVVLPVSRPPLEDGAVLVADHRIAAVGTWAGLRSQAAGAPVIDLGESILLPGLINAHCHLDYTDLAGEITPTRSFTDWIKVITTAKSGKLYADFAQAWLRGARMLLDSGTSTVADVESVPELLPEVWEATPMRVFSFLEMTGVRSRREPQVILDQAVKHIESLPAARGGVGLSPHAPYSTAPRLLSLSARKARKRGWRLTVHVAESSEEFEMFVNARGKMFDWIRRNERDVSDCGLGSPVQHLERQGCLGDNLLAVHVNYLAPGDAALLGRRGVSVVHCPRSHAYFRHRKFPYEELVAADVNVCLGTDSLATVARKGGKPSRLDMFYEMRTFAAIHPDVPPETIVRLATINGARALGREGLIGELIEGAFADLIAIPFSGGSGRACEAVLRHTGGVLASMIDGRWAIPPSSN